MKAKKSLQRFTESELKINEILSHEQITPIDLLTLTETERDRIKKILSEKFNNLKGTEADKFYEKIELIIADSTKNQLWENNHSKITWAISNFMKEYGRMPNQTDIAKETELSRQTIQKHLKEYTNNPLYLEQIEQFRFMTSKVLAKVYQFAINGDIRAAKLYLNSMGLINNQQTQNSTLIQNQNNYIQINGTVLSQETIKHLKPEQLNMIETILKTALPQPE